MTTDRPLQQPEIFARRILDADQVAAKLHFSPRRLKRADERRKLEIEKGFPPPTFGGIAGGREMLWDELVIDRWLDSLMPQPRLPAGTLTVEDRLARRARELSL